MTLPYASTTDFALVLPGADSALLGSVIEQVSRNIDAFCGRVFYTTTETRYFDLNRDKGIMLFSIPNYILPADACPIDDFLPDGDEVVTLDGTTLTADQYEFHQINGTPKSLVKILNGNGYRVGITGNWGYAATIPSGVKNACLFLSRLTYQALTERQLKSERMGTYSLAYADTEGFPTPDLYSAVLRGFCRVGIH